MHLHLGLPGTSGTGMAWCLRLKISSGGNSICDRSFPLIVGLVVVLVCAQPFSPIIDLGLSRVPAVLVTSFSTRVSACALNRLLSHWSKVL